MFKKFLIVLVLLAVILGGLQIFGGRDFSQVSIAWQKYSHSDDFSVFTSDISKIFAGKTINQGGLATALLAEHIVYRWVDEYGVTHVSERKPKIGDYEEIRMGDLTTETQKALDEEEVKKALNKQ